jgi:hypothetical protein
MTRRDRVSRRDMLIAGAVGGIAAATGMGGRALAAAAQSRIEKLAPELDRILVATQPIPRLATGYGGDIGPAEGPLWWSEGKYLLFNDINSARRMKYMPGQQGATLALDKTNEANGITRDLQGRILSAEHLTHHRCRQQLPGQAPAPAQ